MSMSLLFGDPTLPGGIALFDSIDFEKGIGMFPLEMKHIGKIEAVGTVQVSSSHPGGSTSMYPT